MHSPSGEDLLTLNRAALVARLLSGVTHEVNNALLVIGGTAELLEDRTGDAEAVEKALARIKPQIVRAAGVIAEVQGFARGAPSPRAPLNLRETISSAIALRAYAIGRAGLKTSFTAPDDVSFVLDGSRVLLQQAVLNLLVNAEQALAGQRAATIGIDLSRAGSRAVVRVSDPGPGIASDQRDRIFEPFVTSKDRAEASGLGLAAARQIAGMHGGSLELERERNETTFALSVPFG